MNKPDDIPQDVWDAAILYSGVYAEPAGETLNDLRVDFARSIMAERERCAKVAETESTAWKGSGNFMGDGYGDGARNATLKVASDIRKGYK